MKTDLTSFNDEYEVRITPGNPVAAIRAYTNFVSIVFEDSSIIEVHMDYDNLFVIDDE